MQGFNMGRYNPPSSLDPSLSSTKTGGFNSQGHPLGNRARKIDSGGGLIVRFEMPFRIWCETCKPESIIDQGVRFNAEKKKVGNYFSSPIWSFRMKHTACGGMIEIRTDPKSSKYVVTEGARLRDYGESENLEGAFGEIITEEERERRKNDAMAALEGTVTEKGNVKKEVRLVEKLLVDRKTYWEDTYTLNQRLRRTFRGQRKTRAVLDKDREAVADRLGLGFEVLDATQEDRDRAALVEFGGADHVGEQVIAKTTRRPLFETRDPRSATKPSQVRKTKAELKSERSKTLFKNEVSSNSRAAMDPFLITSSRLTKQRSKNAALAGIKRKRNSNDLEAQPSAHTEETPQSRDEPDEAKPLLKAPSFLVAYDSDED